MCQVLWNNTRIRLYLLSSLFMRRINSLTCVGLKLFLCYGGYKTGNDSSSNENGYAWHYNPCLRLNNKSPKRRLPSSLVPRLAVPKSTDRVSRDWLAHSTARTNQPTAPLCSSAGELTRLASFSGYCSQWIVVTFIPGQARYVNLRAVADVFEVILNRSHVICKTAPMHLIWLLELCELF